MNSLDFRINNVENTETYTAATVAQKFQTI